MKAALTKMVEVVYKKGFRIFISGGAVGVDQWFAQIKAGHPDVRLVMAIPFPEQASIWPEKTKKYWKFLCSQADHVHTVCESGYANWEM